jgi:hypothetical protein
MMVSGKPVAQLVFISLLKLHVLLMTPLCSHRLDEGLKGLVAGCIKTFEYPPGSHLFEPGNVCNEMHILLSGE